jgi:hypothetical protein
MDLCRQNAEREMGVESQGRSTQSLSPVGIDPPGPVPPDERFRDPGTPSPEEIGKAAEQLAIVLSQILSSPHFSDEFSQKREDSQQVKNTNEESVLYQTISMCIIDVIADSPAR